MKHVFNSNHEVCSIWAKQEQSDARTPYSRVSFEGVSLFSYSHYEIARLYPEQKACLINSNTYSVTTARHINLARYAVRSDHKCFDVPCLDAKHSENIGHYLALLKETVMQWDNATIHGNWILSRNSSIHNELADYCKVFGQKMPVTLGLYLDPEYPFIKQRFWKLPPTSNNWRGELFLPRWLASKGMNNVEPKDILRTKNAEIRREIIRLLGIERICYALNARVIDKRDNYELITLDLRDGRQRPFLKMLNPSVPDIWHVEGVHPCIKTVQDALNYRRYGNEMLELGKMPETIRDWLTRQQWENNPENMVIKAEYQTSELFRNVRDWSPEQLT